MTLYHGSSVGGLTELKPFLSEHGKPYLYFSSNPVVALLYSVKPVPKSFRYYPYGFDGDIVVYSEYYANAFSDIYKGKRGFLYEVEDILETENPTHIKSVYTCESSVKVQGVTEFDDVYEQFIKYAEQGLFRIKSVGEVSEKEMAFVCEDLRNTIDKYQLKDNPDSAMSEFMKRKFPEIWNESLHGS